MPFGKANSICSDVITESENNGHAGRKGFAEYALYAQGKGRNDDNPDALLAV